MNDADLKFRLLQLLGDEPQDEYGVTTLGAAVGVEHGRVLQAIAELVRDGFLEAVPRDTSGHFELRIKHQSRAMAHLRASRFAQR